MRTYICFGCGMSDMAESFAELRDDDWDDLKVSVFTPGKLGPQPKTLHFCGQDCKDIIMEERGLTDDPVTPQQERIMLGDW